MLVISALICDSEGNELTDSKKTNKINKKFTLYFIDYVCVSVYISVGNLFFVGIVTTLLFLFSFYLLENKILFTETDAAYVIYL